MHDYATEVKTPVNYKYHMLHAAQREILSMCEILIWLLEI